MNITHKLDVTHRLTAITNKGELTVLDVDHDFDKYCLIINPKSKSNKLINITEEELLSALERENIQYTIYEITYDVASNIKDKLIIWLAENGVNADDLYWNGNTLSLSNEDDFINNLKNIKIKRTIMG